MALVQNLVTGRIIADSLEAFPSGTWGSYAETITPIEFTDGIFEGYYLNWGGFINNGTLNSFISAPYAGYTTNWGGTKSDAVLNSFTNAAYAGYTTNFGAQNVNPVPDAVNVDIDSIIDRPKDQFVYYKLKGYNPNTQTYETWVEKENITARPELFNPGAHPPTYERNVNLIAPSGNALINIIIVGRWIE